MQVSAPEGATLPAISGSIGKQKSWLLNYSVISFLMNGQLIAEYNRISNMLGLPHCSDSAWYRIVGWLELHVTRLAEWLAWVACDKTCRVVLLAGFGRSVCMWRFWKLGHLLWWFLSDTWQPLKQLLSNITWLQHRKDSLLLTQDKAWYWA